LHLNEHFTKRDADKRTAPEFETELQRLAAESAADAAERLDIRNAAAKLSPQQRNVFELLKDHKPDEVAQLLGISPATVGVVTHRIKKIFSL
jgi:DNA-directed RNA polymerase specialized sigma24 family protein